jgi:hypothetical protein
VTINSTSRQATKCRVVFHDRRALLALLALLAIPAALFAQTRGEEQASRDRRLQPPDAFDCPRDNITAYSGKVVGFTRGERSSTIEIATDWDTREKVNLTHRDAQDLFAKFRIEGQPWSEAQWKRIESAPGRVQADSRATVWVCREHPDRVLIDWHAKPPAAADR